MPCVHPGILAGLSVPKEFSRAGRKHREFCATFVLFCAVYAELCAMLLVADSDIMPCVHCGILAGLSVSKEFSSI